MGEYSHAEGNQTETGTQYAYLGSMGGGGLILLDSSYSDISADFGVGDRLYLYDKPFDDVYNRAIYIISQSYFDFSNTIIELTDTSVNTSTVIVGNLNLGINNWNGDQTIPGLYSHTEGVQTYAIGIYSHAEGDGNQAVGEASHAEGSGTKAIGNNSHAEGRDTVAIGDWSHAEGDSTQAIGAYSHAEGDITQAIGDWSHAEGISTKTGTQNAYLGIMDGKIAGAITLDSSYGDISADFGGADNRLYLFDQPFDNIYGRSIFIISQSYFDSPNTIIELTDISVNTSTVIVGNIESFTTSGIGDQTIPGTNSHTEGENTLTIGKASHTEGGQTLAIGDYSHAEGSKTITWGSISHAEGDSTEAIGEASHAEGIDTITIGEYSHAEGTNT